jgi:hypothetical protein
MPLVRRLLLSLLAAACALPALAVAQERFFPTFQKDPKGDVARGLDIVRVALGRGNDGRLRGELTMARSWDADDLRGGSSPGTVCLRLYTARDPESDPADHLVCASAPAEGDELRGGVFRDRVNGLPKRVADAVVSRPTSRTIYLRFAQSAIGRPATIRFAGETVLWGSRCSEAVGCRDTAPDAPGTVRLPLRASR